jgi:mono/diheme cytochrome c family protein
VKLIAAVLLCGLGMPAAEERGKDVFQACSGCHNVLTDARKAGPSLRTLFGKVRLGNGKRVTEDNVAQLILDGYNGMPSYRNMFRPEDWTDLMAYLKTLRGRPEVGGLLKPARGADKDILAAGQKFFSEHCASCHKQPVRYTTQQELVAKVRDGHNDMAAMGADVLDDEALFMLASFVRVHSMRELQPRRDRSQ